MGGRLSVLFGASRKGGKRLYCTCGVNTEYRLEYQGERQASSHWIVFVMMVMKVIVVRF